MLLCGCHPRAASHTSESTAVSRALHALEKSGDQPTSSSGWQSQKSVSTTLGSSASATLGGFSSRGSQPLQGRPSSGAPQPSHGGFMSSLNAMSASALGSSGGSWSANVRGAAHRPLGMSRHGRNAAAAQPAAGAPPDLAPAMGADDARGQPLKGPDAPRARSLGVRRPAMRKW